MRQLFRLTEQDLHNIVKSTVLNIIKEGYHDTVSDEDDEKDDFFDPDGNPSKVAGKKKKGSRKLPFEMEGKTSRHTLKEDYPFSPDEDKFDKIERQKRREQEIEDYWRDKNERLRAKYPGRSREWYEAMIDMFENTIKEDAGAGGGATNCAGTMQTGSGNAPLGTNPEAGQYTVPFGKMQRRKIYNPKGDAKGDVTKQESNVDMSPAMARKNGKGGSISIPKRTNENKEINEGWFKNAAMAGAMAGMMGVPQTANAAPQDDMYNVGRNKTAQKAQSQKNRNMTITTTDFGYGKQKNDTVYWDNVNKVTPELHQRLTDLYNNGKKLMSSEYKEDIVDMIQNSKPNSIAPNTIYWGSYEVVDTSNETAMINSIQSAGLVGLKSTNPDAYYGIVEIGGGTFIVGMSGSNYVGLPKLGLKR